MDAQSFILASALSIANYYLTTLAIWVGHWYSHQNNSPLASFHILGHHAFYPDSKTLVSRTFIYGQGRRSSIYALLPWLLLQTVLQFTILSLRNYVICLGGEIAIVVLINYLHTEMHVRDSWLENFSWFIRARRVHAIHHDRDINYMVADHLWDRAFATYAGDA